MNGTEAAYALTLEERRIGGDILWYRFEGIKLRLADNTFYSPDFVVMDKEGLISLHEVKGTTSRRNSSGIKQPKPFIYEDAAIKMKIAAEVFPFVLKVVFYDKSRGAWIEHEY